MVAKKLKENRGGKNDKLFIIRKYIYARSASDALRKERYYKADEIFFDDDWKKAKGVALPPAIGFVTPE